MRSWTIYLIGVVVFGLAYYFIKQQVNGAVFVIGAIAYLASLNWAARRFGRK
jgi:hypothetical protein